MRPLARRLGHDAFPLQVQLRPSVAPAEAVVLHQMLVKMLDRKTRVALAIEPLHLPALALLFVTARPPAERPLAHPEQLRRLFLIELRRFPAAQKTQKHRHAHPLKGFCPAHPTPPKGPHLPDRSCAT